MAEPFHREYQLRLPLPLAQLYGRAYNAEDARGRHDNSFYLFEAFVKLAATPLVASYLAEIEAAAPRVAGIDRLLAQLALPSLGQWVQILRELARYFGTRPDSACHPLGHIWGQLSQAHRDKPALLSLYRRIRNGPDAEPAGDQSCSLIQVLDALVRYRNEVFGHGAGRSEAFYDTQMGPLLFPAANELLAEGMIDLLGPRGSRLLYLTQIRALENEQVEVAIRDVIGSQTVRSSPLTLTRPEAQGLAPKLIALLWPGRKVPLRLDPLLIYRESETSEEVLFLNRGRNDQQVEYLSYTTGRTDRDAGAAASLAKLLSRVTGAAAVKTARGTPRQPTARSRRTVPPLLPYMADRHHQEEHFALELAGRLRRKPAAPVVCVVHGDEDQCHDKFIDRLRHRLPALLDDNGPPLTCRLDCRCPAADPLVLASRWTSNLAGLFGLKPGTALDAVSRAIAAGSAPLLLEAPFWSTDCRNGARPLLDALLHFLETWPCFPDGARVVACICVHYVKVEGRGLFQRFRYGRFRSTMQRHIRSLQVPGRYPRISPTVLPQLENISLAHALHWATEPATRKFCRDETLAERVRSLYEDRRFAADGQSIPMKHLADRLKEILASAGQAKGA